MLSNRKGFTLIELLIVVVIIGILAAIAIPKFANTKEKAYIAAMKSDLRNLTNAQEAYFTESLTYATELTPAQFQPSTGVTYVLTSVTGAGWAATASHDNLPGGVTCTVYVGAAATAANVPDGEPRCQ
jgi:type IV pilus assembly protein PilA